MRKPKWKVRPARFDEVSKFLHYRGYEPFSCGDCCFVQTRKMAFSDQYVIQGIDHRCGKPNWNKGTRKRIQPDDGGVLGLGLTVMLTVGKG